MLTAFCRNMIRNDLFEVLHIEQCCFEEPWTEKDFVDAHNLNNCFGRVAEISDGTGGGYAILGFLMFELYENYAEIVNLAVCPDHQRCGIGSQLVEDLNAKIRNHRKRQFSEVRIREGNTAAHLFFQKRGFWAVDPFVIPNYYENGESAYVMEWRPDEGVVTWDESDILEQPE